jgi:hypothetical protein
VVNAIMKKVGVDVELNSVAGREPDGSTDAVQGRDFAGNPVGRVSDGI